MRAASPQGGCRLCTNGSEVPFEKPEFKDVHCSPRTKYLIYRKRISTEVRRVPMKEWTISQATTQCDDLGFVISRLFPFVFQFSLNIKSAILFHSVKHSGGFSLTYLFNLNSFPSPAHLLYSTQGGLPLAPCIAHTLLCTEVLHHRLLPLCGHLLHSF